MKTTIIRLFISVLLLSKASAGIAFLNSLPPSCTNADYAPFLGIWKISALGDEPLAEPIMVNNLLIASNRVQATITSGGNQAVKTFSIANLQGHQFVNLADDRGVYNIFLVQFSNSGSQIKLTTLNESQLENDVTNSVVSGQIFSHSRGLKDFQVSASSGMLAVYFTNRFDVYTNKWVILDKVN